MDVKTNTTVTLTLNNDEANWLKELMQNPLPCGVLPPKAESDIDYKYRNAFWIALVGK